MPPYFLSRSVHFCEVDDGIVFLDLRKNRYFGIPAAQARVVKSVVRDWEPPVTQLQQPLKADSRVADFLMLLIEKGIITMNEAGGRTPAQPVIDSNRVLEPAGIRREDVRVRFQHIVAFIRALTVVVVMLRLFSMEALLARLARKRRRCANGLRSVDEAEIYRLIVVFKRIRLWAYTTADACLKDSLVLKSYLQIFGIDTSCVIGVSTRPFAAHAWVRYGDAVLNDTLERIQDYTPLGLF